MVNKQLKLKSYNVNLQWNSKGVSFISDEIQVKRLKKAWKVRGLFTMYWEDGSETYYDLSKCVCMQLSKI
jgi:hypothetical protein